MTDQEALALAEELAGAFPGAVEALPPSFGMAVVKVRPNALGAVARHLKAAGFEVLLDVGGVDYLGRRPPEERFEVVYHLLDPGRLRRIRLKVPLPEARPELPTVSDVWPAANWAEREAFDLFGVRFVGHPDLRRLLLPEDWQGHPLRKDYPLRGPQRTPPAQALRSRFFPVRRDRDDGAWQPVPPTVPPQEAAPGRASPDGTPQPVAPPAAGGDPAPRRARKEGPGRG